MKNKISITGRVLLFAGFFFFSHTTIAASAQTAEKRFIVSEDGIVQDNNSGLSWASKDNGANITWADAKTYCQNYSAGGYNDWRMPTSNELATLYGNREKISGKDYSQAIDVITPTISITAPYVWSSEKRTGNKSITFSFNYGTIKRLHRADGENRRALPVR